MIEQSIERARQLHLSGQFAQAIAGYDEVLAQEPARAEVWHLKGMAEHQSGQLDSAYASASRAIEIGGVQPAFLLLEAGVLHDRGDLEGAAERFAKAAAMKPQWAAPLLELGRVRMDQGLPTAALEVFRAASAIDARNLRAWNGIGMALLTLGRTDEALRAFNHALTIDPKYAYAHLNLGRIFNLKSDWKRALEHAINAIRFDPKLVDAYLLAGDLHRKQREPEPALGAYSAAVKAEPANLKARNALAELLAEMGLAEKARDEYRAIAERNPGNLKAALGANLVLPQVYQSREHLEHCRVEYLEGLERLHDLAPRIRFPRGEVALAEARWTNFYLAYQGKNDVRPQRRYAEFLRRVLQTAVPEFYEPRPKRAGGGRIRVGFLSHFFYNCTVGRYFASWLTGLDRAKFEVHVYYTNEWVADDTKAIAARVDKFHHLPGRAMYEVAQQVVRDDLDILVYPELGMHPETFTLANLRLAPVQCAGWGHPDTTGHEAIDWFISCELMEPAGAKEHYSERLTLLPGLGTRYGKPAGEEKSTRADFGLPEDKTLYLLPQSLFKIHPDNDELIAEVIHRDPDGLLVAFASHHDAQTNAYGLRLAKSFERRGLDLATRTRFVMPFVPHASYVRLNALCDVMLDTLHWSGGNTSLDALASGLPVVTLPGEFMRGRQSRAMLTTLEAGELIAANTEDYVERAVALGRDKAYRMAVSERIRANHGLLFDRDEPLRALERFFEAAVL